MTTFRELCNDSVIKCIELTIQGIKETIERPDFRFDLSTYGKGKDKLCYGCIATCAIQKIANVRFTFETINAQTDRISRYDILSLERSIPSMDTMDFESAINQARLGQPFGLLMYFRLDVNKANQFVWNHTKNIPTKLGLFLSKTPPETIVRYFENHLIPDLEVVGIK